ncbi:MAG: protein kinase [Planctomycetota bacterium]|nr:protein kinase [Planctomycetota bacterium]
MKNPFNEKETMLAKSALAKGFITKEQLNLCAKIKRDDPERPLVAILLSKGFLKEEQLGDLMDMKTEGDALTLSKEDTEHGKRTVVPGAGAVATVEGKGGARIGKYKVVGVLGEGGMGKVYKCYDEELRRYVAVKVMLPSMMGDENAVRRFLLEAESAARLNHPHIIPIYEIGAHNGNYYFVMEYVEGRDLRKFIREEKPSKVKLLRLLRDVALAVHHAHMNGIIHRDLKPANIMVDKSGNVRVMDFGLAKRVKGERDKTLKTTDGTLLGTPEYMPPEQAEGKISEMDTRSDVYSLGVIMYQALVGKLPFTGASLYEVCRKIFEEEPERPSVSNPKIDWELETIILKAMEKKKEMRYESAKELADEIERYLKGEPLKAARAGWWYFAKKRFARNKPLYLTIGVAALLLLTLAVWFISAQISAARRIRIERDEAVRQKEIAEEERLKAEEARKKEEVARKAAEDARRNEEEARMATVEALKKEEIARKAAEEARRKEEQMRKELQTAYAESVFAQARALYEQRKFHDCENLCAQAASLGAGIWTEYLRTLSASQGYRLVKELHHTPSFYAGYFLNDENLLLISAESATPFLLNMKSLKIESMPPLPAPPFKAALSQDGRLALFALTNGNCCLYSLVDQKILWHNKDVSATHGVAMTRDYAVVRGNGSLTLLDRKSGAVVTKKDGMGFWGFDIPILDSDKMLAIPFPAETDETSGKRDIPARIKLFSIPDLKPKGDLVLDFDPYLLAAPSSGAFVVACGMEGKISVYDWKKEFVIAKLDVPVPPAGIAFIKDHTFLTFDYNGAINVWDTRFWQMKEQFFVRCALPNGLCASENFIVTLSSSPAITILSPAKSPSPLKPFEYRPAERDNVLTALSPDGKLLAISDFQTLCLLDTFTGKVIGKISPVKACLMTFDEDGNTLFICDSAGSVAALKVPSLEQLWFQKSGPRMDCPFGLVSFKETLLLYAHFGFVLLSKKDGSIKESLYRGPPEEAFKPKEGGFEVVLFSPPPWSRHSVFLSEDEVAIFEPQTREMEVFKLSEKLDEKNPSRRIPLQIDSPISALASDRRALYIGTRDGKLLKIDIKSGSLLAKGFIGFSVISLKPFENFLAVLASDGKLRMVSHLSLEEKLPILFSSTAQLSFGSNLKGSIFSLFDTRSNKVLIADFSSIQK